MTCDCATEGCYATITLDPKSAERLRSTHETFYCPAGHLNFFPGPTKQERLIDDLKQRIDALRVQRTEARRLASNLIWDLKDCPVPGCSWRSRRFCKSNDPYALGKLAQRVTVDREGHLAEAHGMVQVPDDASELVT